MLRGGSLFSNLMSFIVLNLALDNGSSSLALIQDVKRKLSVDWILCFLTGTNQTVMVLTSGSHTTK